MTFLTTKTKTISVGNSFNVPLAIDGFIIGTSEDVSQYHSLTVSVISDVDSLNLGFIIAFSSDNTNWDIMENKYTYHSSGGALIKEVNIKAKYFRVVYVNNATVDQTEFRLQTSLNSNPSTAKHVDLGEYANDIFGRLRTSQPVNLLDITHVYDSNELFVSEYINDIVGATSTHDSNKSTMTLTVSGNGDRVTRQSRLYTRYQPGKALHILATGIINSDDNEAGSLSRLGYFDDDNGLFFEYDGSGISVVLRSKTSGSVVDTTVSQSDWNIDTMDGDGPSGITIDVSKALIYDIQFAWLGVGIVRFGVHFAGKYHACHVFRHTDLTSNYMVTPNLPIRFEMISGGGTGSLTQSCGSVTSEAGYKLQGYPFSTGSSSAKSITDSYVCAMRLATGTRRQVILVDIQLISTNNALYEFSIYHYNEPDTNPITGSSFSSVDSKSAVEFDDSGVAVTLGTAHLVRRGYFTQKTNLVTTDMTSLGGPLILTGNHAVDEYKSDYIIVKVKNLTVGSENVYCSLSWIELH